MAIYSPGAIVGAISGNVGGVSFANTSGSKVIRKPRRAVPNTSPQILAAQNQLAAAAAAWKSLSDDNQKAWNNYAANRPIPNRLGQSRSLSGYNTYVKARLFRLHLFFEGLVAPPINPDLDDIFDFSLTSSLATGIDAAFQKVQPLVDVEAAIYGRPLFRSTIPKFNNSWRFLGPTSAVGAVFGLSILWDVIFSPPVLGQVVAIRIIPTTAPSYIPQGIIDLFAITTA